jgi:hypothetical protein
MKNTYLLLTACLVFLFSACKNDFDLNSSYKDITVVYGILDHNLDTNYVKIYKGFQSRDGQTFINAQTPDSIYYYDKIRVILEEYKNNVKTKEMIMGYTHDFPRDAGIFYYGEERIIYYTDAALDKDAEYKIVITHKDTKKVTTGRTPIVGDFRITNSATYVMTSSGNRVDFEAAKNAFDYEIHVNFLYFEVDKSTNQPIEHNGSVVQRIVRNITPQVGIENWGNVSNLHKVFTQSFYADIAAKLKPNPQVIRYPGTPDGPACIEMEAWAADESLVKFLISNQHTSSFTQINTKYTNLDAPDGSAFGFLSSRSKSPATTLAVNRASQDSLVYGSKTRHLGFRYREEYTP